jgi:chromosome segregation ATPase
LKSENDLTIKNKNSLIKEYEPLKQDINKVRNENISLKQKLEAIKKEDSSLLKKCSDSEIEINKLKSENDVLKEENTKVKIVIDYQLFSWMKWA